MAFRASGLGFKIQGRWFCEVWQIKCKIQGVRCLVWDEYTAVGILSAVRGCGSKVGGGGGVEPLQH